MDTVSLTERAMALRVQARRLDTLALSTEQLDVARVYEAYRHLAADVHFQIVRDYWVQRYLLQPVTTEQAMGQQNFVVQLLAEMRAAGAPERLPEGVTL